MGKKHERQPLRFHTLKKQLKRKRPGRLSTKWWLATVHGIPVLYGEKKMNIGWSDYAEKSKEGDFDAKAEEKAFIKCP